MFIIDGKSIADKVQDEIVAETFKIAQAALPRPNLAIILIGEREDSRLYVSLKQREAVKVGIDTHLYKLEEDVEESEVLQVVEFLNNDSTIDAILIQLPLPKHLNTDKILAKLDPEKDADGFLANKPDYVLSPVVASILRILSEIAFVPQGKKACILHNSDIFGATVKETLEKFGLEVQAVSLKDFSIKNKEEQQKLFSKAQKTCLASDLIVSALGLVGFIDGTFVRDQAVVIDIGISKVDGKTRGDADFDSLAEKNIWLTPVPGGIGPMTIAMLFKNVLAIYNHKK
ncbi:MAG: bifunctional 5,10-methylenetetrahydrofolate dehydrogenase/5,10-methenyltetrahydrofolate cyclohydrolase [Candidatus Falkowbacteria bacterium]|nr:bifunctional 5,10-methylenetetrahydrofolate dehydrogenase/5,10-methenyltetrahydrofolate cyclohydrolase [Candidatus Falkowbacteria bacterium]